MPVDLAVVDAVAPVDLDVAAAAAAQAAAHLETMAELDECFGYFR